MKQTFKSVVIDKFDEISLNQEQLAKLANSDEVATDTVPKKPSRFTNAWKIAACFTLVIALFGSQFLYQNYQTKDLLNSIANEAIANHLKKRPLEIESQNLPEVLAYFTELDFNLIHTADMHSKLGDQLLGGRYCSINGVTAAQFRVRNANGNIGSWYQGVLPNSQLSLIPNTGTGEAPSVYKSKGVEAQIWRNQGVVFVKVNNL